MKTTTDNTPNILRKIYVTYPYNTTEHTRAVYCSISVTEKVKQAAEQCTTWNELRKALQRILRTNSDCVIAYAEEQ